MDVEKPQVEIPLELFSEMKHKIDMLQEERDFYKDALEMFRDDAQRSLDHYLARENGGQLVDSPRYPVSLARDVIRNINNVLKRKF